MNKVLHAAIALVAASLSGAAHASDWRYDELVDPITDAKRGIAVLRGEGGTLVLKCDTNGPKSMYAQVITDKYLGALQYKFRNVIFRFDGGPLQTETWHHDGRSALQSGWKKTNELALAAASAQKIVIRLSDFSGSTVDVVLNSGGDDTALRSAYAACGAIYPDQPVK